MSIYALASIHCILTEEVFSSGGEFPQVFNECTHAAIEAFLRMAHIFGVIRYDPVLARKKRRGQFFSGTNGIRAGPDAQLYGNIWLPLCETKCLFPLPSQ